MGEAVPRGEQLEQAWLGRAEKYSREFPGLYRGFELMQRRDLPQGWDRDIPTFPADGKGSATRESGGKVLNALAKNIPWLLSGAADLARSTKTGLTFDGACDFSATNPGGRNLHFGIREHVMASSLNGLVQTK